MQPLSIRALLTLCRLPLSLSVTFSAFVGYSLCAPKLSAVFIAPLAGVLFLAAGASALNQFLERKIDALMERTMNRPIPSGRMKPSTALGISIIILISGVGLFILAGSWIPLILGIGNVIWYCGVYTPLKRKTTLSLIPGAITGAVPVFMGWTAAGGDLFDAVPIFLGIFMFFWQVPHFWLLMLTREQEYRIACIPKITDHFTLPQVKIMIMAWLIASSMTSLMIIARGFLFHPLTKIVVLVLNAGLLIITVHRLFFKHTDSFSLLYILVNCFLFAVLSLLLVDKFLL